MEKNIVKKTAALVRKIQREIAGESNRVQMVSDDYLPTVAKVVPAYGNLYRRVISDPALENKLEYAQSAPVIEGSDADVHNVRCFDNLIGKLAKSFNKDAAILKTPELWPDNKKTMNKLQGKVRRAIDKLNRHSNDLAGSFARVTAYTIGADGEKQPVKELKYNYVDNTLPFFSVKLG